MMEMPLLRDGFDGEDYRIISQRAPDLTYIPSLYPIRSTCQGSQLTMGENGSYAEVGNEAIYWIIQASIWDPTNSWSVPSYFRNWNTVWLR